MFACTGSSLDEKNKKKISMSHLNKLFNNSIGAEFLIVRITDETYHIVHTIDLRTNYEERCIFIDHYPNTRFEKMETL